MSMPSDVSPDSTEALASMEADAPSGRGRTGASMSQEIGLAATALVAFVGIAILGPAVTRLLRPKPLSSRLRDKATVARYRVATATVEARKKGRLATKALRRLGGGTIQR